MATVHGEIGERSRKTESQPARRLRAPSYDASETILMYPRSSLKKIREKQKISVAQIAKKTGIAPQTIIQFEDTGRRIRFTLMHQIAECLGYELDLQLNRKSR